MRRFYGVLSICSALLGAGFGLLYLRTGRLDGIYLNSYTPSFFVAAAVESGRFFVQHSDWGTPGFEIGLDSRPVPDFDWDDEPALGWSVAGFACYYNGDPRRDFSITAPLWFPMLMSIWASTLFLRLRIRRRRPAAGHCPACGYDLRATPGRCPECGEGLAGGGGPVTCCGGSHAGSA